MLGLLLAGLPEGDVRRLEVFLGLRSDRLRHARRIVAEGPVDLYLHGADEAPTIPGRIDRQPLRARVADARPTLQDDIALLQRPLQDDAFVDLLVSAEDRLRPPALPAVTVP